jgi:hypothetical protein
MYPDRCVLRFLLCCENVGSGAVSAGFTPTPWKLGDYSAGYTEIDGGHGTPNAEWIGLAKVVTRMTGDRDKNDNPIGLANARLIAASPTMAAYIQRKSDEGDEEAARIMEAIHARR